jgi:hypothetical protein
MPGAATGRDDDRDRISIPIHNQRALSRPVYKTGSNALGAKRCGGGACQSDRHTPAANPHDLVAGVEQRFEVNRAHASLLTTLAKVAKGPAISLPYVVHCSASLAPRRIPCGR